MQSFQSLEEAIGKDERNALITNGSFNPWRELLKWKKQLELKFDEVSNPWRRLEAGRQSQP